MVSVMASTCETPTSRAAPASLLCPRSPRRPDDRDAGVGRQLVSLEVHVRQRERLVVEATGALAHLFGRGRKVRLALPRPSLSRATSAPSISPASSREISSALTTPPSALDHGVHARGEALVDPPDAVYGAAVARDLEIMFGARAVPRSDARGSSFHVASYWRPPRGQKSQHSEQPVHILTSVGKSSSPIPIESVGQAATHTPHCTQRSASMTACSRSQNQTFPGPPRCRSSAPGCRSQPQLASSAWRRRRAPQDLPELHVALPARPRVEAFALAPLLLEALEDRARASGTSSAGFAPSTQSIKAASMPKDPPSPMSTPSTRAPSFFAVSP